eukprot:TRINITY_DN25287_c0_g1_i1.p1 TRINITY_DN25287_c0_g1~~TRINITY_DN25287_c0_g1_i1.p1  ORF type:complete len:116 (-),score=22.37 TRINITY_DN25287_c0_g1_i1:38-385(-)
MPSLVGSEMCIRDRPANMLKEKNTVALSQTMSRKLFGNENPVGKIISYNGDINLKVDGVFEDVPHNSHMQFDVLISFETLTDESIGWEEDINPVSYTHLTLPTICSVQISVGAVA